MFVSQMKIESALNVVPLKLAALIFAALIFAAFSFAISVPQDAQAQGAGKSYPLVYGSTGRPYGPTQAHYQYQLRYGRPWHGGNGRVSRNYSGGGYLPGYAGGAYFPVYGTPYAPAYYGLNVPIYATPNVIYPGPIYSQFGAYGYFGAIPGVPTINHVPFQTGGVGQTMIGRGFQPDPFLPQDDFLPPNNPLNAPIEPTPIVEESTPQQRERALRMRVLGDEAFAITDYRKAGERYREAASIAPDQADPRYRLAISLAARGRFEEAVEQLKTATTLDMEWPSSGVTLDELYGLNAPNNDLAKRDEKNRIKTRIAEWTNRDVRDPNRLFLLAVVMMLDGDVRAKGLLETAIRLNGVERHLIAFLTPLVDQEAVAGANQEAPNSPRVFDLGKDSPAFIPPAPEPNQNRGEITGEERARRVFEKAPDSIPAVPEELKNDPPTSKPPKPDPPKPIPTIQELENKGPALPARP